MNKLHDYNVGLMNRSGFTRHFLAYKFLTSMGSGKRSLRASSSR